MDAFHGWLIEPPETELQPGRNATSNTLLRRTGNFDFSPMEFSYGIGERYWSWPRKAQ